MIKKRNRVYDRRNIELLFLLFLFSLLLRFLVFLILGNFSTPLLYDEHGYFMRAIGFADALRSLFHLQIPEKNSILLVYGSGVWPPLHPLLLALGILSFGRTLFSLRLVVLLISSLTTPLVYCLTLRLAGNRAAKRAAQIYALYPAFIFYSHYLWSETIFIFLLLLSFYFVVLILDNPQTKSLLYPSMCGISLGLCGLTRAAGFPFIVITLLWMFIFFRRNRLSLCTPIITATLCFLLLLPWELVLLKLQGEPALISTKTGYALFLGNNPWVKLEAGSGWRDLDVVKRVRGSLKKYSKENSISQENAARKLAVHEIGKDLKLFLSRSFYRFRMLWSVEFYPIRHILHATYPPMSEAAVIFVCMLLTLSYTLIITMSVLGLLSLGISNKPLMLCMVIFCTLPPVVTISMSRLHLPILALLLPAAGVGVTALRKKIKGLRLLIISGSLLLICSNIYTTAPVILETYMVPSVYYSGLINRVASLINTKIGYRDQIIFRDMRIGRGFKIKIRTPGYYLGGDSVSGSRAKGYEWVNHSPRRRLTPSRLVLNIYSKTPNVLPTLSIQSSTGGYLVDIVPIKKDNWRNWTPTGIKGLDYMWCGGGVKKDFIFPEENFT